MLNTRLENKVRCVWEYFSFWRGALFMYKGHASGVSSLTTSDQRTDQQPEMVVHT